MAHDAHLTPDSLIQWSDAPVSTEVENEVVLMSLERGRCYGLGDTGSAVWRKLGAPIRVDALCDALATEYNAEREVLTADVLALLEQLRREGLVQVVA